jgi:hypothetical protein
LVVVRLLDVLSLVVAQGDRFIIGWLKELFGSVVVVDAALALV